MAVVTPAAQAPLTATPDQQLESLPVQAKQVAKAISSLLGILSTDYKDDQIWGKQGMDVSKVKDYVAGLKLSPDIQTALGGLKDKAKGTPVATVMNSVTTAVGQILTTFEKQLSTVNSIADQANNFEMILHKVLPQLLEVFKQAGGDDSTAQTIQSGFDSAEKMFNAGEAVLRMINVIDGCVQLVNSNLQIPNA